MKKKKNEPRTYGTAGSNRHWTTMGHGESTTTDTTITFEIGVPKQKMYKKTFVSNFLQILVLLFYC